MPAVPAMLLLFGMVFGFAAFHIAGVTWVPLATHAFYGALLVWGILLLLLHWRRLLPWVLADVLFLAFLILLSMSLVSMNSDVRFYAKLLPFLVLLPYLLGRLSGEADAGLFLRLLPWLGVLLLLLCAIDYWWVPDALPVHSRIRFFGMDHSPLLIAQLIAAALLALTLTLLQPAAPDGVFRRPALPWILFAAMAMALVLIAARGVLVAVAVALLVTVAAMPAAWLRKLRLLACFALAVLVAYVLLPSAQAKFYKRLVVENAGVVVDNAIAPSVGSSPANPACKPFQSGMNSVVMRLILYREALDLSLRHPLLGVGAGNFGDHSCAGPKSYPHSTVLQAFAELGVAGGGLLLALLASALVAAARALFGSRIAATEAVLWLGLLALFGVTDQIYGSYFMAAGSFFMFGVCARLTARCRASSP